MKAMKATACTWMTVLAGFAVSGADGQIDWAQLSRHGASMPAAADNFGSAVSMDGDWAVVGGQQDDNVTLSGYAAILRRVSGAWSLHTTITSGEGAADDNFGHAAAISGTELAIGTYARDDASVADCGAVYTYRRSGTTWSAVSKVVPMSDESNTDRQANAWFGYSVAMHGSLLVVGCPRRPSLNGLLARAGAVYVYNLNGSGNWTFTKRITLEAGAHSPQAERNFGWSVATNGATIMIGAPGDSQEGTGVGACFEYILDDGDWVQYPDDLDGKLTISSLDDRTQFGNCVSANKDSYLIGVYPYLGSDPHSTDPDAYGHAYVCGRDKSDDWRIEVLSPPSAAQGDGFGFSVALDDSGRAVVGANERLVSGNPVGQVFVFDPVPGQDWDWAHNGQPLSPTAPMNGGSHDWFGGFVDIQGWTIIVGASWGDTGTTDSGVAYMFGATCYANCDQSTGSPLLTPNDFTCFQTKFANNEPYANCDGVGGLTANDVTCFINKYSAGCT